MKLLSLIKSVPGPRRFAGIFAALVLSVLPGRTAPSAEVSGAFIQFNRANAAWSVDQWKILLNEMQNIGLDTVIIQWTAEEPVLYFKDEDDALPFKEKYDTIERFLEAAQGRQLSIWFGLQNDPGYWREITGRDKVLRDYFLVRLARNERLQAALLEKFGPRADWTGYYIPDEIDDLSWRESARQDILRDYLRRTIQSLRKADAGRSIAVSAFFRARTAPTVFTKTIRRVTSNTGLSHLLIQDGAGNGAPPLEVTPMYYRSLLGSGEWREPALWLVLEAFRQTSGHGAPFSAEPAPPERFSRQIKAAAGFKRRIIFSFPEYLSPGSGPAARTLYEFISGIPTGP